MDKITEISYKRLLNREYRNLRSEKVIDISDLQAKYKNLALRCSARLMRMAEEETPIVYESDRIGFYRTIKKVPELFTEEEKVLFSKVRRLFDGGYVGNISSDYATPMELGFDGILAKIDQKLAERNSKKQIDELNAMKESIFAVYKLTEKYQVEAENKGNKVLAKILKVIPYKKPSSYHEALVFMRIINYFLWLNSNKHNTLGRFDQYMYQYYINDINNGVLTKEEAVNLTEEFFISLNYDADLYPGVQQGDNGQSMVLGGIKPSDGSDAYNELSEVCLLASLEVKLIDPKINLRVNKNTPLEVYELGTKLTKQGLGFPQYSNDDVVIPALVKLGYDLEDARNYVVAACWEFIIPGLAMDIPNLDALSFPSVVLDCVNSEEFLKAKTYEEFETYVKEAIDKDVCRLVKESWDCFLAPSPYQSILMEGCIDKKADICECAKYNNYGFHGAGLSTAADSLAAIKKLVFETKEISKEDLLIALKNNFEGYEHLQKQLLAAPKMGNNDDYVDDIGTRLLDYFSEATGKQYNARGGIYRAGTGTAMYYIWYSEILGATPDGRKKGEPFAANFSPSLNHNFNGVLSVVQSFAKPHLIDACNGGPLTLEFHDTLFRNKEGESKVAMLVKTFIALGGHQLQLNAINRDTLLDAQIHPEDHKNLIVRVWGWSGYFNELDLVYQNHIIKRLEFLN